MSHIIILAHSSQYKLHANYVREKWSHGSSLKSSSLWFYILDTHTAAQQCLGVVCWCACCTNSEQQEQQRRAQQQQQQQTKNFIQHIAGKVTSNPPTNRSGIVSLGDNFCMSDILLARLTLLNY